MSGLFDFPPGYDERTMMALTPDNRIVLSHPELPPLVYDEAAQRWIAAPQQTLKV